MVDVFSDGAGTDQGCLDASVSNSFGGERSQKCLSLIGGLSKLVESLAVGNHTKLGASIRGRLRDTDRTSSERPCRGCNTTTMRMEWNRKKRDISISTTSKKRDNRQNS